MIKEKCISFDIWPVWPCFCISVIEIDTWKDRCEDTVQAYDEDMIRDMKRSEVEDEVRKQVDVLMREELDMLKIVSQTPIELRWWKFENIK